MDEIKRLEKEIKEHRDMARKFGIISENYNQVADWLEELKDFKILIKEKSK